MENEELELELFNNKFLFEKIHVLKSQFANLLTEISNAFPQEKLLQVYPSSKGTKVSMGNELQHCPYQVLDIFRNFDKANGHNIRVLNWWGHGLYLFVHFGKNPSRELVDHSGYEKFIEQQYALTTGSSPWDYQGIIQKSSLSRPTDLESVKSVFSQFGYLQWLKEIPLEKNYGKLKDTLLRELESLFRFNGI
jgi:hypothetical protein